MILVLTEKATIWLKYCNPRVSQNARARNLIAYNAKKEHIPPLTRQNLLRQRFGNDLKQKTIKARLCKKGYRRTTGRDLKGRVLN